MTLVGPTSSVWQLVRPASSASAQVQINVQDAQGTAVDKFTAMHTKKMHLIGIRTDTLDLFAHNHPKLKAGTFSNKVKLPTAGKVALFDEYDPAGALPPTTDRYAFDVGASTAQTQWDFQTTRKTVDGLTVTLKSANLMVGMPMPVEVEVLDASGSPAPLKKWLGTKAHMLAAQDGAPKLYHFHANDSASDGGGAGGHGGHDGHGGGSAASPGTYIFSAGIDQPGAYRLFLQVVKSGKTKPTTVTFDVVAA